MYVSRRAIAVIRSTHVPSLRINRLILRDRKGAIVRDDYFWISIVHAARLLDQERSVFSRTPSGGVKNVQKLVVLENNLPDEDLFLFLELNLSIMTERLIEMIGAAGLLGAEFHELETMTRPI